MRINATSDIIRGTEAHAKFTHTALLENILKNHSWDLFYNIKMSYFTDIIYIFFLKARLENKTLL